MEVTGNSRKDYLKSLVKSACSQTNASNLCQKCNWSGLAAGGRYLWQARIYRKKYLYSSTLIYFLTFERFVLLFGFFFTAKDLSKISLRYSSSSRQGERNAWNCKVGIFMSSWWRRVSIFIPARKESHYENPTPLISHS